jgi:hypothetical protein
MTRQPDRALAVDLQRGRDELSAAWAHQMAVAEHGARQLGEASRRWGALARDRTVAAGQALRGELPVARWRWAGVGLAAGVVIGAVGAAVLARLRQVADQADPDQSVPDPAVPEETVTATVRERAGTVVAGVKGQAGAAVHGAASAVQSAAASARGAVGRVREKVGDPDGGPQPPATPESTSTPS